MLEENKPERKDIASRKMRRIIVIDTLVFCATLVAYIVWKGTDSRLYETALTCAFSLSGSVIGFYIAGSAWQDAAMDKVRVITGRRPAPKTKDTPTPKMEDEE